ncbi:MAG TPA: sulfatase-like hydrolase/transferase [Candidatus Hydrogenedentes bacterium]|nr:sulfatase-like hydrolase/transferase [Candidatus Hydrogenedentota bacterium]HQM49672.1 sulfatase-like hydrolase/transferase [Candidatus Hydrogenedentota bacterium]
MAAGSLGRREFLKKAGLAASTVLASGAVPSVPADRASRRPNIVFIQTDSWDGRVLGCMGHPAMRKATPNLDALADRGVLFRNAYCNNPICCPSRASMWSGRHTYHCEGWNNYKGLSPNDATFRTQLDAAGYRTQTYGKEDYLSGAHSVRARVSAWTRSADIARPQYRMAGPELVAGGEARVHLKDWENTERAVAWLEDAAESPEKSFLLYLGVSAPHPKFMTSDRYYALIDERGVTIPPADRQDHPVMAYQRAVKNWMHGFSEDMVQRVRRTYYAMCAEVDTMSGEILAALERTRLADNTYVIFTSDHGENALEHRQFYKMNHYESSARVPLIIAGPDVQRRSEVTAPVSLVDIYPTLMDMANIAAPDGLDGHSLMPELIGTSSNRPDWVLSEFHDTTLNTGTFMLRRGDWKYIVYVGHPSQLFNLKDDPDEVWNRAGTESAVVGEMDALLRRIVDYEAVDAKVKAYDRESFAQWRDEQQKAKTYKETMARIFSGWDDLKPEDVVPWKDDDEARILAWLHA